MHSPTITAAQQKLRDDIQADVDKFLADGGVITFVEPNVMKGHKHLSVEYIHTLMQETANALDNKSKVYAAYDGTDELEEYEDEEDY